MIVILRPGAQKARVEALMSQIKQQGVDIHYSQGATGNDSRPCRRYDAR